MGSARLGEKRAPDTWCADPINGKDEKRWRSASFRFPSPSEIIGQGNSFGISPRCV